jgi:hypothetical protein
VIQGEFLPTTLSGWIQLLVVYAVALIGALAAVWRVLTRPIRELISREREERIERDNALKDRVAAIAQETHTSLGRHVVAERAMERQETDQRRLHEHVGKLDAQFGQLDAVLRKTELDRVRELGQVNERLSRIDTKLDLALRKVSRPQRGNPE